MRKDSILANYYYKKLPKAQYGIPSARELAQQNISPSTDAQALARMKANTQAAELAKLNEMRRKQGEIKSAEPKRSIASKALAIATNPVTALSYKVKGQDIPEHFERGELNPYEHAVNMINPAGIVNSAVSIPGNISRGEYLKAGMNVASILPALGELRAIPKPTSTITSSVTRGPIEWYNEPGFINRMNEYFPGKPISQLVNKYISDTRKFGTDNPELIKKYPELSPYISGQTPSKEAGLFGVSKQMLTDPVQYFTNSKTNTLDWSRIGKTAAGIGIGSGLASLASKTFFSDNSENAIETPQTIPTKVPQDLLLKQVYKESGFNPRAVSPKGFKGIAQIGEDVIEDYKKKSGDKTNINPYNPRHAKKVQDFMMNELYNADFINKPNQTYDARMAKTLAAYNWGRGNLSDFLNQKKSQGVDIYKSTNWVKDLPKETRDYINLILFNKDNEFQKNFKTSLTNPSYKDIVGLYNKGQRGFAYGGAIKDDRGQWAHPGEITEIGSNNITMDGVPYPVLGISDEGDTQMMFPGEDYKFKGKKVTEFPMAQKGGTLPPIYTSNPNDPRLKSYQDSLILYNSPKLVESLLKSNGEYSQKEKEAYWKAQELNYNTGDLFGMYWENRMTPIGSYLSRLNAPDKNPDVILTYKKPVQPVEYRKPEPIKFEKKLKDREPSKNIIIKEHPEFERKGLKNLPYRVEYRDEHGRPTSTYFENEAASKDFWQSTPGEKTGYYERKEYGGPLVEFYKGKMTGPNIFKQGGQSNEGYYNYNYNIPEFKYAGPTRMNEFGYLVDAKAGGGEWHHGYYDEQGGSIDFTPSKSRAIVNEYGGDISIPQLPDLQGPLLQYYYSKGGLTPNKAREILHDKEVHGHPLTEKQRRFFGAMSKGNTKKY